MTANTVSRVLRRLAPCLVGPLVLWLLASCNADQSISRDSVCRFTFLYQYHPTSQLFVAAQNPGSYVFVTTRGDGKSVVRRVFVQGNAEGAVMETNDITTAVENNLNYLLGANNDIGLIIGCTNLNGLRAYDRTCPNCEVMRALQWTGNREQVVCNDCHRTYVLETGAVIAGAEGKPLQRYNCAFNGTSLNAWN